jgi:LacI family transcriptional regulator
MAEKPKLDDVAKRAGVSFATASMGMSGNGRISAQTRGKVLEAALALGYHRKPNKLGHGPAKMREIAVLFDVDPEWSMVLYLVRPVIQELERTLRLAGYNTVLVPISRSESTAGLLEKIRGSGAIGVLSLHFASNELILLLESAGIPVVVVMNSSFQDRFSTVCVDDYQGAYEGATCLIRAGHLRLGYVDCTRDDLPVCAVDRFFGFKKAIEEYHLEFDQTMRRRLVLDDDVADRDALGDLLGSHPDITALFALDDDLAVRISTLLVKLGRAVPRDISMIAPGDMLDYSLCYVPPMTTMRIDTTYMGRISAQMMINRLTSEPRGLQVLKVKQQLMRRGTLRKLGE